MRISELVQLSYEQADEKGWNEKEIPFSEMIALIHSEASEALECYRNKEAVLWFQNDGPDDKPNMKPMGIASEFADILIRIGHYSKLLNIDLESVVIAKLLFNKTRPHRHGGKEI